VCWLTPLFTGKSEILNSKSETNSKHEYQMTKTGNGRSPALPKILRAAALQDDRKKGAGERDGGAYEDSDGKAVIRYGF
jgi:hypothetical protein